MNERLKDIFFTKESILSLAEAIKDVYPDFDQVRFTKLIYSEDWGEMALKEKMHHTAECMHKTLPEDYSRALKILKQIIPRVKGFEALAFPDFVERYGFKDWNLSLPALGYFTKFGSAEFAIRPFLAHDYKQVMPFLHGWAGDQDENVRRLASEGCRPRLPWGMRLDIFVTNPEPVIEILEILKDDESETVRRSVANNINDISKDNPEIALEVAERWIGYSENRDWIVKHACRGLLKSGNQRAMGLFGFCDPENTVVEQFKIVPESARIGDRVMLQFRLVVNSQNDTLIRLEYIVGYVKASGKSSKKVFKISERSYTPGTHRIKKSHNFADMSTRKHYPGIHRFSIKVNGVEKAHSEVKLSG
ncbi:MAG: DNA alkylation repair protein [Anaerolineales bacterium]|jgi:3-methyladenine DNA glycosylase AlkC